MADFPRQRRHRAGASRRRRSQADSRGAGEAQSKTRPAKMADSAPLGFVNPP